MTTQNRINSKFYQIVQNTDGNGDIRDIFIVGNISANGNIVSTSPDSVITSNLIQANNLVSLSSDLGNISNIIISGGIANQVLTTDGNGNLSFTTVATSAGGNTTEVQYNDNGTFAGTGNFTFDSATGTLSAPFFSGDGSGLVGISAGAISGTVGSSDEANTANYAGNVTEASQPNITSVGTLTELNVTGVSNLNGNVLIPSVSNLILPGGTIDQFLKTDGNGNLSFATLSSTSIVNGNSNVSVLANSDITMSSNGVSNVVVVSDVGMTVNGVLDVTSNVTTSNLTVTTFANLGSNSNIFINGGVDGYVLSTDGFGNLSWVDNSQEPVANSVIQTTKSPTGFDELTKLTGTTIEFDNTTRTFTISPVGLLFDIWVQGNKFQKTSESITIPDVTGTYYIYYDVSGTLIASTTVWDISTVATVSYLYWNSTNQTATFFFDERHGTSMDSVTHEYLHRTRGASMSFAPSVGFTITASTIGTGSLDSDAEIGLSSGTFYDEDIQINVVNSATPTANTWQQDLTNPGKIPVAYRIGNEWTLDVPTNFPIKFGTTLPTYNLNTAGTWSVQEINNNSYFVMFVIATNNLNYPVIAIMGQDYYTNISDAEAVNFADLDTTGLPISELRPLYNLIYQGSTGYTNTIKARLRQYQDIRLSITATASLSVSTIDSQFRETPQTVFQNNPTANLAWDTYVDDTIANYDGNMLLLNSATLSGNLIANIIDANIEITSNIITANVFQSGSSDVVTINANSYITTFGNTGTVTFPVAANIPTLNVTTLANLGSNSNVRISGGSNGQLLSTDGLGNLSWITLSASGISNGTSNVSIPTTNGNVTISSNNVSNVVVISDTTVDITGNVNATNANLGNIVVANYFVGDGSNLSNINGSNVNLVANANFAAYSGNVTVNSQPNITSVGTLTSLDVTGNITGGNVNGGNLVTANFYTGTLTTASQPNITSVGTLTSLDVTGNITGGNANLGNLVTANFVTGTLTTASQPNITSLGTLTGLTVNGISNLGPNSNVVITGGSDGQVLRTDGTGNLSWITLSASGISNGTSNINIPSADSNITFGVNGFSNVLVLSSSSLDVTGNVNSLNANLGNTATANYFTGTLTTNSQPNITSTGTLTTLDVSGVSNLNSISNVLISGGNSNEVISTNGSGNLSFRNIELVIGTRSGNVNIVL